jgi:hypothetical protein
MVEDPLKLHEAIIRRAHPKELDKLVSVVYGKSKLALCPGTRLFAARAIMEYHEHAELSDLLALSDYQLVTRFFEVGELLDAEGALDYDCDPSDNEHEAEALIYIDQQREAVGDIPGPPHPDYP